MTSKSRGAKAGVTSAVAAEKVAVEPELHEVVAELEKQYSGTFHRSVDNSDEAEELGGKVIAALETKNGDRVAGRGANTEEAVKVLAARLEKFANA